MHVGARGQAGDPFRFAARERGAPVQAHRELHAQPGAAALDAAEEATVEFARGFAQESGFHRDARGAQAVDRATRALGRIIRCDHHAREARGMNQRFSTARFALAFCHASEGPM